MLTLTNARVFDGREMLSGSYDVGIKGRKIASLDHSGAHIAERMWWMRIDSPVARRWSDCAS